MIPGDLARTQKAKVESREEEELTLCPSTPAWDKVGKFAEQVWTHVASRPREANGEDARDERNGAVPLSRVTQRVDSQSERSKGRPRWGRNGVQSERLGM